MSSRKEIEISNDEQITNFVQTSSKYYITEFNKIGNSSKYVISFNKSAFY